MLNFLRALCAAGLFMVPLSAMTGCEVDVEDDPIEEAGDEVEDATED